MQNLLFFQGPVQIGKSTFLRNEMNRRPTSCCGFTVQRLTHLGKILGYQVELIKNNHLPAVDLQYESNLNGIFLLNGKKDVFVLEQTISFCETTLALSNPEWIVLDEIGGMELRSDKFMGSLYRILAMGIPCVGIVKSRENLLQNKVFHPNKTCNLLERHSALLSYIQKNGYLISLNQKTVGQIPNYISSFFTESIAENLNLSSTN